MFRVVISVVISALNTFRNLFCELYGSESPARTYQLLVYLGWYFLFLHYIPQKFTRLIFSLVLSFSFDRVIYVHISICWQGMPHLKLFCVKLYYLLFSVCIIKVSIQTNSKTIQTTELLPFHANKQIYHYSGW